MWLHKSPVPHRKVSLRFQSWASCWVWVLGQAWVSALSATTCQIGKSWTSRWGRLWHQESGTILSLAVSLSSLLFNCLVSMDWNISITLFSFTSVQGLAKRIRLDAKSKPWSPSPRRWQFWHIRRVQSRGTTFFPLIKRRTSADSVKLCSFTQRRLGPMACSVMVSIRDISAQSL